MNNKQFTYLVPSLKLRRLLKKNFDFIQELLSLNLIRAARKKHSKTLTKLKGKSRYKIVFFMVNASSWKYDSVYRIMADNHFFDPIVVIIPFLKFDGTIMHEEMLQAESFCSKMGYNYMHTWDEQKQAFLDIKIALAPDIVFFTHPYPISHTNYSIQNCADVLTCWVPYSLRQEKFFKFFDLLYHNLFWRVYCESSVHLELSNKYARNKGANVVATGHPIFDSIKSVSPDNASWRQQDKPKKRIIWAPHWTIKGYTANTLYWSNFLKYCDTMLEFAVEFQNDIQFSFKPHPLLKDLLAQEMLWGRLKTEKYYKKWQEMPNCQLDEADYLELFAGSDALIHDCGSFMIEYLTLNKPVLYLQNKTDINGRFNEYGERAIECHYVSLSENDLRHFIEGVVLADDDPLQQKRVQFAESFFYLHEGTVAQRIMDDILKNLNKM